MGLFNKIKEAKAEKKAKKLAEKTSYNQLSIREADLAMELNSGKLTPEERTSKLKELETVTKAKKMIEENRSSQKQGLWWLIKTIVGLLSGIGLMALSVKYPEMDNKLSNKSKGLFDKISNKIFK